ncbi:ABC transporter permease [Psychromarinibacter sp. C21-152]|uniref:ABC transporter permease n=1 Tax=Psychromarinibacter sediminicola TaxID=3033385 RepID=A0AAE3NNX0_9RHOB|nr:ABC transporter permease [Psychromarinibacter sediminicola]MDF0599764.1 ABC transporter permease [Psychromarinibacter sediminicola]
MSKLSSTGEQTADAPTPEDAFHESATLEGRDKEPPHGSGEGGPVLAADGTPLKRSLQRALRREKLRALGLIAPLLIFVLVTFIAPIADMLFRSVENQIVSDTLPETTATLQSWDSAGDDLPPEAVFEALYYDLFLASEAKRHTRLGTRLNYEETGLSSLFRSTGRSLDDYGELFQDVLEDHDEIWESAGFWYEMMGTTGDEPGQPELIEAQRDRLEALTGERQTGEIGFVPAAAIGEVLPRTADAYAAFAAYAALEDGDTVAEEEPWEAVFAALASDLRRDGAAEAIAGYDGDGAEELQAALEQAVPEFPETTYREFFLEEDEDWGSLDAWGTIQAYSPSFTPGYFLNAVDLELTADGVSAKPEGQQIYVLLFQRTLFMSLVIMGSCVLLGYPVAYLLSNLPMRVSNLLMILVLLPFWTSLLVRTSAWKVLLQQQGVINDILVWLGLVADDARLVMINNQFGTIVAMTHILLPFMILPLYSVMKTIPPSYVRAAKSLGATPWTSFWRVYFPQSIPGIGAGCILVFILAIGYYITPELVGGTTGTFISNRIAYHISSSLNWGLAAALGTILLAVVLILYWVYDKIVGIDNVSLG